MNKTIGRPFQPGQSGNPSGRAKLDPDVRAIIKGNGEKAARRMQEMIDEDENFNRRDPDTGEFIKGAMSPKEQLALMAIALDRAYGRSENISISHTHSGTVGLQAKTSKLQEISERLPERIAQQNIINGDPVTEVNKAGEGG